MQDEIEQLPKLEQVAGLRRCRERSVLVVEGDDRRSWLNGQLTNDVRQTAGGDAVYALAVTVKGKIMADLWALDRGEDFALVVPRTSQEALLASFDTQIIMEDVEVAAADDVVLSLQGPRAEDLMGAALPGVASFPCDELGLGGRLALVQAAEADAVEASLESAVEAAGGTRLGEAAYELARLRHGRPRFEHDFGIKHYPQEAGLKARAVSFNKGCYLGQEVICTLESRGRLSRQLVTLESSNPLRVGDPLVHEGASIGEVTSAIHDPGSARWLAMGYVKRAQAQVGTQISSDGTAEVTVTSLAGVD